MLACCDGFPAPTNPAALPVLASGKLPACSRWTIVARHMLLANICTDRPTTASVPIPAVSRQLHTHFRLGCSETLTQT